jgi:hypothetical protein
MSKTIPLSRGLVAIVDDADFESLSAHKWYAFQGHCTFYAVRNVRHPNQRIIYLHRVLLNAPFGLQVDHVNRDGLDNRRCNLRFATNSQNNRNRAVSKKRSSSGYKGVSWSRLNKNWRARITINGLETHLGAFATPEAAHAAYCVAAKELHGEFARFA